MNKFLQIVKHELREAVFPTIFFFLVFHLMLATESLILESHDVVWLASASALVTALIVAKAVLLVNMTSVGRMFRNSRLVYQILWKTVLYSALVVVFRYAEELIPLWSRYGSFTAASSSLLDEVSWPQFWAIQLWLFVSIAAYSTIDAIDDCLGKGSLRSLLLGRANEDGATATLRKA